MKLTYNDEQQELARIATAFANKNCTPSRLRALRDADGPIRYTPEVYEHMAQLGWLGVHIPEEYGGVGLGFTELAIILEALGAGLAPEPLIASLALGAITLLEAGTEAQKSQYLPNIANGSTIATLAHQEHPTHHDRNICATTAQRDGDAWRLNGRKIHVLAGDIADEILIVARTSGDTNDSGGRTIFHISGEAEGLERTRLERLDSRNAAHLTLNNVRANAVIGEIDRAADAIDRVLDRATVAISAEALGASQRTFDTAVQYLKDRVQFGVPIGSFQALQHRAADLYAELELARSVVLAAARAVEDSPEDVPALAAGAKATINETFLHIARESIQFHGGVGVTDEYDVGLYLKRAHIVAATLGDTAWQRARWASLHGY